MKLTLGTEDIEQQLRDAALALIATANQLEVLRLSFEALDASETASICDRLIKGLQNRTLEPQG